MNKLFNENLGLERDDKGRFIGTHKMSKTRLYQTWMDMKYRCNNVNNRAYKYYGGRGIKICDEWLEDAMNFYTWSINNGYRDNLTIDRFPNNNGNYEPNNCRWVTIQAQQTTTRRNKYFKAIKLLDGYEEINNNQKEFARKYNLNYKNINNCLKGKRLSCGGWKFEYTI